MKTAGRKVPPFFIVKKQKNDCIILLYIYKIIMYQ